MKASSKRNIEFFSRDETCFDLAIETGRYNRTPREERLCSLCDVVEDEQHVLFSCRAYNTVRTQFTKLLAEHPTPRDLLNPTSKEMAEEVGLFLKLIEDQRGDIF